MNETWLRLSWERYGDKCKENTRTSILCHLVDFGRVENCRRQESGMSNGYPYPNRGACILIICIAKGFTKAQSMAADLSQDLRGYTKASSKCFLCRKTLYFHSNMPNGINAKPSME
ncbi:hypothetical protein RvY_14375-2 [Ramazzottius varieornatus]|uniref:Uncharacterized protein n=1 Tax=Ramazzottius varieornatus TaxID=947166 RepID=A0A1D1VR44_RAMVA|nr:hypothetical protein RvY_14375-2 [Ramazzottius varieornatus]